MQERKRIVDSLNEFDGLDYCEALDLYRSSKCLPVPSTRIDRESRRLRTRVSLGVNKDWLKGRHGDSRPDRLDTDMSRKADITVDNLRARVAKVVGRLGTAKKPKGGKSCEPSVSNPPREARITECVHVIILPDGRRVFPDLWDLSFQNLVRVLRERENVSQEDVSRMTGLTRPCVSATERGIVIPRLDTLAKMLGCLHLSRDEFDLVCLRYASVCPARRLVDGESPAARDYKARRRGRTVSEKTRINRLIKRRREKQNAQPTGDTDADNR